MKVFNGLENIKKIENIKILLINSLREKYPKIKFIDLQQEDNFTISKGGFFKEKQVLEMDKYGEIILYEKEYLKIIEGLSEEIEKILGEEISLTKMYEEDKE